MKTQHAFPGGGWPVVGLPITMLWFAAYAASMTVQPLLRLPGTAGVKHFQMLVAVTACFASVVYWAVVEQAVSPLAWATFWTLVLSMTLVQLSTARIKRWRGAQVHDRHIGLSLISAINPFLTPLKARLIGEFLLCALAGAICGAFGFDGLGRWLLIAGAANAAMYLVTDASDRRPEELIEDDIVNAMPIGRRSRRVQARVVSTNS